METIIMENQMEKKMENEMEYIGVMESSPNSPQKQILNPN